MLREYIPILNNKKQSEMLLKKQDVYIYGECQQWNVCVTRREGWGSVGQKLQKPSLNMGFLLNFNMVRKES